MSAVLMDGKGLSARIKEQVRTQVEAMAQVASIVMLRQPGNASKLGYFMSADKVKFRRVVVPGDTLIIEAELTKMRGNIGQATARCLVNGQVVSEAELKFGLQDA